MSKFWSAAKDAIASMWETTRDYLASIDRGMVAAIALKVIRHALTTSGGVLELHGFLAQSQFEQWLAAAPFLLGLFMSLWDAYVVKRKIANAVVVGRAEVGGTTQKNTAVAALKAEVKS